MLNIDRILAIDIVNPRSVENEKTAMTQLTLQDRQIWQDLISMLENIDSDALVKEHLDACDYRVCGYWDEDDTYYEEIVLPSNVRSELVISNRYC